MAHPSIPVEGEEVIPESVDLHSTLPTQTAMKLSKFQYFNPRSSLEKKGLIPFRIVSGDDEFIDPYHTYICIVTRILDGVGNKITEQDGVGAHNANSNILMVNGLSHAWFKKINVWLNGENISFDGNMYAHQGDIKMRLSYPQTVKESSLNMSSLIKNELLLMILM